jgi:hypothetical protein
MRYCGSFIALNSVDAEKTANRQRFVSTEVERIVMTLSTHGEYPSLGM